MRTCNRSAPSSVQIHALAVKFTTDNWCVSSCQVCQARQDLSSTVHHRLWTPSNFLVFCRDRVAFVEREIEPLSNGTHPNAYLVFFFSC